MVIRILYIVLGLAVLLALGIPNNESWYLPCPLYKFTGLLCPFCGGQRMIHALIYRNWSEAFSLNPFLFCSLPLFALWSIHILFPQQTPILQKTILKNKFLIFYLILSLLWGFIRNLYLCK